MSDKRPVCRRSVCHVSLGQRILAAAGKAEYGSAEDGDGVYYIEDTNEFVILSTDGYIRTYFRPSGGKKYFDKQ